MNDIIRALKHVIRLYIQNTYSNTYLVNVVNFWNYVLFII